MLKQGSSSIYLELELYQVIQGITLRVCAKINWSRLESGTSQFRANFDFVSVEKSAKWLAIPVVFLGHRSQISPKTERKKFSDTIMAGTTN